MAESGIPVLDMAANYDELGTKLDDRVRTDLESYGLELRTLLVENISLPPAVEEALDKRTSMGVIGDMGKYTQYQAATAIGDAAKSPDGGGLAAGGMGAGLGMAMASQIGQAMSQPQQAAGQAPVTPPPLPQGAQFYAAIGGQQAGPFGVEDLKAQIQSGAVTKETLVWSEGMADWAAAAGGGSRGQAIRLRAPAAALGVKVHAKRLGADPSWAKGSASSRALSAERRSSLRRGRTRSYVRIAVSTPRSRRPPRRSRSATSAPHSPQLEESAETEEVQSVSCTSCAALVEPPSSVEAFACPYCGSSIVTTARSQRLIKPQALLSVRDLARARGGGLSWLDKKALVRAQRVEEAREARGQAPRGCTRPTGHTTQATVSRYTGQRGDNYSVNRTVMRNGKPVTETVTKIRWRPAAGSVARDFDDVLVVGSPSLPRDLAEEIEPWDLGSLVPLRRRVPLRVHRRALSDRPSAGLVKGGREDGGGSSGVT